ncbi:hypothetical protein QQP08_013087 [Theobroma cacao]|nr:hypothetical protein QQP08_013087 [Theobroma cacao]
MGWVMLISEDGDDAIRKKIVWADVSEKKAVSQLLQMISITLIRLSINKKLVALQLQSLMLNRVSQKEKPSSAFTISSALFFPVNTAKLMA